MWTIEGYPYTSKGLKNTMGKGNVSGNAKGLDGVSKKYDAVDTRRRGMKEGFDLLASFAIA